MVVNFDNWCRLCTNDDRTKVDVFSTKISGNLDLKELILKHFDVNLQMEDEFPNAICVNCYDFIEKVVKFTEVVKDMNKLFLELARKEDISNSCFEDIQKLDNVLCTNINATKSTLFQHEEQEKLKSSDHMEVISIKPEPMDDEVESIVEVESIDEVESMEEVESIVEANINENLLLDTFDSNENKIDKMTNTQKYIENECVTFSNVKSNFEYIKSEKLRPKVIETYELPLLTFDEAKVATNNNEHNNDNQINIQKSNEFEDDKSTTNKYYSSNAPYKVFHLCKYCRKRFESLPRKEEHICKSSTEKRFGCKICQKFFFSEYFIAVHMKTKHGDIYKNSEVKFQDTFKTVEFAETNEMYSCDRCNKCFSSIYSINRHIKQKHKNLNFNKICS